MEDKKNFIVMNMDELLKWIDNKYNIIYKDFLETLNSRFYQVYSLLKKILEVVFQINTTIVKDINLNGTYKPLIDNLVRLLDVTLSEFSEYVDLEFVEMFFNSIQERMQIFWAHIHQLSHFSHSNNKITNDINDFIKTLEKIGNILPKAIIECRNRTKLSYPLLKHIYDSKNIFKIPIKKLKLEITRLSINKTYDDYEKLYKEVKYRSNGTMKIKIDFIEKMIDLVKEASQYQFALNKFIKPYFSMASLYKNKINKFQYEHNLLTQNDQIKLLKYVNLLTRSDFVNNYLLTLEQSEFVYIIKLLNNQNYLVNEYKKSLIKGVENYEKLNIIELEILIDKYRLVMNNIYQFQEETKNKFDQMKFSKDVTSNILKDIKKVVDRYKDYQNGIFQYEETLELFYRIRNFVVDSCYKIFNIRIELVCEYNF